MLAIKVPLRDAQKMKKYLLENNLLAEGFQPDKVKDHIYFPINKEFDTKHTIEEHKCPKRAQTKPTLRIALEEKLPEKALERLKTAYDQVGDIGILEIDEELKAHESLIGETLLSINPQISTVLAKDSEHAGTYRTQKMRLLAGIDSRIGVHKENNVTLKVDVEEVYFSSRLATERKRILELVKEGEKILVMFSGCGPYICVLSKNTLAGSVIGVEINPKGHALAEENIVKNKLKNAKNYCGDVKKIVPEIVEKGQIFDRILMPLPRTAETFLDTALMAIKPKGIIHFYSFLHQDEFGKAHNWIKVACEKAGKKYEVLKTTKCGQQAPYVFRICVDFQVF